MNRSRLRRRVIVPNISTRKTQTRDFEYVKGFNTNTSNDDLPTDQWRLVQDARENYVGKWDTRKGTDLFSVPVGEAVNVQQSSTTGASAFSFNSSTYFAARVVATGTGPLTALEAKLRNAGSATGTVVLALYTDVAGSPGAEIFRTTISNAAISSTSSYIKARSITCPDITSGTTYWVVGFVQDGGTGSYEIATTTAATTGKTSTNSGQSWSAASYDFNVKLSTSTAGGTKGHIRIRRPNGTSYTFFAHGSTLYSVNESTGATTAVDTGLTASATFCRFAFVNDVLYYVTGVQKPRKYNFSTATEVSAAPENAWNLIVHKGLVFYQSADDRNKSFYTNFASYDAFTSTDFLYVDSPKTSDPQTAYFRLMGNLFINTRNNKFVLYGSENATFRLDNAVGQKGTFSQESVAYDEDFAYLASDDGIYKFNGAEERNIARDVLDWWTSLDKPENTVLELYNNRLYCFYTPNGQATNSKCRVYNTLYDVWESEDTNTYVGNSYARYDQDNYMILGSNRAGFLMLNEQATNDWTNMGEPLNWELRTAYQHYDAPAQLKSCTKFRPHFDTTTGNYSVQIGYATDYSDSANYSNLALQGGGSRFNTGVTFDSGATFGGSQQVNPLDSAPHIAGQWRRLQLRYKHSAAREPMSFDGHVLELQIQRLK